MYTIGEISKKFNLPISTLRYYDNQGLFPEMERVSGIRKFSEKEVETLHLIECLKKSGFEIKDIKQYMDWCMEGNSTLKKRKEMFIKQKARVEAEIEHMNKVLDMIKFKCWYYEKAIKDKTERKVLKLIPDKMPKEIQKAYDNAHS